MNQTTIQESNEEFSLNIPVRTSQKTENKHNEINNSIFFDDPIYK